MKIRSFVVSQPLIVSILLVAPLLFQGYSSSPHLSQISYLGLEGLLFSYYDNRNTTFSLYSNSTYNVKETNIILYTQSVDPNTGRLYENAFEFSIATSTSVILLQEAFNMTQGYASLGAKWKNSGDLLFLSTQRINGTNGVVSLGFSVSAIAEFFMSIYRPDGILYLAMEGGEVLVQGLESTRIVVYGNSVSFRLMNENGDELGQTDNVSCTPRGTASEGSSLNIHGRNYTIYCSSLDILGVQSVYVLAFPKNRVDNLVRKSGNIALILLLVMVLVIVQVAKREVHLCANLIRQMEATQQAERKNTNKSNTFAKASHDIRASLAAITGLKNMNACTKDLLGILNLVLDTSKIEAGKMQLEDEEFDLGQLLEDVVDLYHPLGMKKGIDVVLDPCGGSIIKFSRVRGDRGKLKQILCNLLSNAVKFTYEGHANVRAWVKKPSLQDTIVASKKKGVLKHLHGLISKNKEERKDVEAINRLQENSNFMEFVFEVDDTGKGIPKEEQESVFENYVQVKETPLGQGGTGLGLGIVQSLVRLMGGDIKIVDKKIGEKGTCFRFNVIFTHCETVFSGQTREEKQIDREGDGQQQKLTINRQIISSHSPRLAVQSSNLKFEPSRVILLIQDDKRQDVTKEFMAALGVEVLAVKQWDQPPLPLHTVMEKGKRGRSDSNWAHDSLSLSQTSSNGDEDNIPSAKDRRGCMLSVFKKISLRNSSGFMLLVIDENAEPFQEIWKIISDFRRDHQISRCRVVWLKKILSPSINHMDCDLNRNDVITITKPVHGGRLYDAITLLSEFGGTIEDIESDKSTSSSKEESKPSSENSRMNNFSSSHGGNYTQSSQTNIEEKQIQHQEIQEEWTEKPLIQKKRD